MDLSFWSSNKPRSRGVGLGAHKVDLNRVQTLEIRVVLELGETLVCAYETSSLPDSVRKQATDAGLTWFEVECITSEKEYDEKPKIQYVTVFERPGLHEFLNQLSKFSNLVLFTAGLEGYAKPLVDIIDAENRFSGPFYCKDFCKIVIVDHNPFSLLLQPVNGISCIPFTAGQPRDDHVIIAKCKK
uniref:Mitochondrial import inner membrane translocase subunit TIM50 n=1 Tax=Lactuca sativa TaxID=4236 RepID=A0A9R1VYX6_LACSA|nr:hypothetical protein LSAT_V11C400198810 [Lactuca sativa]